MSLKSSNPHNLVPRVLSYPPYGGRVEEDPGNEVAIRSSYNIMELIGDVTWDDFRLFYGNKIVTICNNVALKPEKR